MRPPILSHRVESLLSLFYHLVVQVVPHLPRNVLSDNPLSAVVAAKTLVIRIVVLAVFRVQNLVRHVSCRGNIARVLAVSVAPQIL